MVKKIEKKTKKVTTAKAKPAAKAKATKSKAVSKKVAPSKKTAPAKVTSIITPELRTELAKSKIFTRGRIFTGKVISAKAQKTVRVTWPRRYYLPKYERFEKRKSDVQAHNPETLSVQIGDMVRISECRPISKTKKFVVIEKLEIKK